MVTLSVLSIIITLLAVFVMGGVTGHAISSVGKPLPALPPATEDDDVTAYLEASEGTSPLAKRLFALATNPDWTMMNGGSQASEQIKLLPAPTNIPKWQHNPDVKTPCEEMWKLFLQDFELEPNDDAKVLAVWRRIEAGQNLTEYEKFSLLARLETEKARDELREIFYPEEIDQPEVASSPNFRWSKQSNKILLTVTCQREIQEECGICVHISVFLGLVALYDIGVQVSYYGALRYEPVEPTVSNELTDFRWCHVDDLPSLPEGMPADCAARQLIQKWVRRTVCLTVIEQNSAITR